MRVFEGEEVNNLSLNGCFIKKFGEDAFKLTRQFESCCFRLARYKNHVILTCDVRNWMLYYVALECGVLLIARSGAELL